MAVTATVALEQVALREAQLARALHAQFRRRLTAEDTRDAVADAIATAVTCRVELAELDAGGIEAWVRTRAYRNAIDQIRAIDGYGAERRRATVRLDDLAETLPDAGSDGDGGAIAPAGLDDELAQRATEGAAARAVTLALDRLTADERSLLRMRHFDGLDVRTIAALLDMHPKKYERLHTRAMAKLRTIFIETTAGEHCEPVRGLIAQARQAALSPALSAQVAAHVESCQQCHAYERRSLKLIATLPLPAPALADRLLSRVQDLVPRLAAHPEAPAFAGAAAGGGSGVATGILAGSGVAAKAIVALCVGVAAVTCIGVLVLPTTGRERTPSAARQPSAARVATPAHAVSPQRATARMSHEPVAKARSTAKTAVTTKPSKPSHTPVWRAPTGVPSPPPAQAPARRSVAPAPDIGPKPTPVHTAPPPPPPPTGPDLGP